MLTEHPAKAISGTGLLLALNRTGKHIYTGDATHGRKADGSRGGPERVPVIERASFRKRRTANKTARVSRHDNRKG